MTTPHHQSDSPSAWVFGPLPDIFLGSGLLYLLFISGLIAGGTAAREAIPYLEHAVDLRPDDAGARRALAAARSRASD